MVALGITAPDESVTVPAMAPVSSVNTTLSAPRTGCGTASLADCSETMVENCTRSKSSLSPFTVFRPLLRKRTVLRRVVTGPICCCCEPEAGHYTPEDRALAQQRSEHGKR